MKINFRVMMMICGFIALFTAIVFSIGVRSYLGEKADKRLLDNGVRVEAEIDKVITLGESYATTYNYTDDNGVNYNGTVKRYSAYSEAESHVGEKVEIVLGEGGKSLLASTVPQVKQFYNMAFISGCIMGAALLGLIFSIIKTVTEYRLIHGGEEKKPKSKMRFVLIVWIAISFITLFGGMIAQAGAILIAGIAMLFGGSFLLSIIMLFAMAQRAKSEIKAESAENAADRLDASQAESESIETINETYGAENQVEQGVRMMKQVGRAWKASSVGDKIKGMLFLVTFLACCALFVVFTSIGHPIWGVIALGVGAGMILISLLVVKMKERISLSGAKHIKSDSRIKCGTVTSCVLSSESSYSSGAHSSTRIVSTVYKVNVDIDGEIKTGYTRDFYNEGDEVTVLNRPTSKSITIIGPYVHTDDRNEIEDSLGETDDVSQFD